MGYKQARLRRFNDKPTASGGEYVLYWMQIYRRLERNHALDYALHRAERLGRSLVVYEGLRLDYPWASRRLHRFILEGMQHNAGRASELGLNYWPFVATKKGEGRGLLRRLCEGPASSSPTTSPDSSSPASPRPSPERWRCPAVSAAAHLRPRIHKAFAEAWAHLAAPEPAVTKLAGRRVPAPLDTWRTSDLAGFVDALPLDASVPPRRRPSRDRRGPVGS